MAAQTLQPITWEAPEHHHIEKGSDWYWALGIITVVAAIVSIIFGNVLFAIVILLGSALMAIVSLRGPHTVQYAVTARGVRIDDELHPYTTLASFHIDEEHPLGPHLLIRSKRTFMPLMVIPLMPEDVEEIDDILAERLPEEHLEESLAHRLLELIGF